MRVHRLWRPPALPSSPLTRFARPLRTHGTLTTGSVSPHPFRSLVRARTVPWWRSVPTLSRLLPTSSPIRGSACLHLQQVPTRTSGGPRPSLSASRHTSHLVGNKDAGAEVAGELAHQSSPVLGGPGVAGLVVEAGEVYRVAGPTGLDGQRDGDVRLADPGRPEPSVVGVLFEGEGGQVLDLTRAEFGLQ